MAFAVCAAVMVAVAAPTAGASFARAERQRVLSPELLERLSASGPDQLIPFTAVLAEQAPAARLRIEADRVALRDGRAASRRQVIEQLKALSDRTQDGLISILEQGRTNGTVREYHALWIANMISGEATGDVIRALAARPEVARIIWDPPVQADEQTDEVIPPEGRRYVPGREPLTTPEGLVTMRAMRPEIEWNIEQVGAPEAWAAGHAGQGTVVAIIDSGMDYTHPDLAGHLWHNEDEIPWNGEDDDFNGFADDTLGWDFVSNDNDPMGSGPTDHGTRVAGIVAGDGTCGYATGVAPQALLMAVRGSGGTWSCIFESIQYAAENCADVIAMSVSEKWHNQPKPDYGIWRQITDNELAAGMFHANSVGNEGDNLNIDPIPFNVATPGNAPAPWVALEQYVAGGVSAVNAVGAVDSAVTLMDYSGRGPSAWEDIAAHWPEYGHNMPEAYQDYPYTGGMLGLIKPDVLAPGEDCLSTKQGGGYLTMSGTSAACPHVAGALAILVEARPDITPSQASMALQISAVDLGPAGKDNDYAAGLIDIPAALAVTDSLDVTAFLSGVVRDVESGDSLQGALVTILETGECDTVNVAGAYGLVTLAGLRTLEVSCFGYQRDTLTVAVMPSENRVEDFALARTGRGGVSGLVLDELTGLPIAGATVKVLHTPLVPDTTGYDGVFEFPEFPADTFLTLEAIHFGHALRDSLIAVSDSQSLSVDLVLKHGVFDDFEVDRGWRTSDSTDTATHGWWVRCDPNGVWDGTIPVQPDDDFTLAGTHCYVTGNGVPGAGEYQNDLDGGVATLTSPLFDARWYSHPVLRMAWWYSNDTGLFVDDSLRIELSNDGGRTWTSLIVTPHSSHTWTPMQLLIEGVADPTDSMLVRVLADDGRRDSAVEVAIDDFEIMGEHFSSLPAGDDGWRLEFLGPRPNPCRDGSSLTFVLAQTTEVRLEIIDVTGRRVITLARGQWEPGRHELFWNGTDQAGRALGAGTYFARLNAGGREKNQRLLLIR